MQMDTFLCDKMQIIFRPAWKLRVTSWDQPFQWKLCFVSFLPVFLLILFEFENSWVIIVP